MPARFAVFLTLEITLVLLTVGNFNKNAAGAGLISLGGYLGLVTATVAWYTSAAGIVNGLSSHSVLPVGKPLWGEPTVSAPAVAATVIPVPV